MYGIWKKWESRVLAPGNFSVDLFDLIYFNFYKLLWYYSYRRIRIVHACLLCMADCCILLHALEMTPPRPQPNKL